MGFPVVAAALSAVVACHDAPNPVAPRPSFELGATANADSIRVSHLCGNRFRVRSHNDAPAEVKWEVDQAADSGRVTVPGRAPGQPYGEVFLTTTAPGTVRLFFQDVAVDSAANAATACPPGAIVPAISPDSTPVALLDSLGIVQAGPLNKRYVRGIVLVAFEPSATQAERQAAVDLVRGTVVGGDLELNGDDGYYYIRLPGDGSFEAMQDALIALMALPQVEVAQEWGLDSPGGPSYRTPLDGDGSRTWRTDPGLASGQRWALEAIRAPLGWGCSVGASSVKIGFIDDRVQANVPGR